MKKKKHKKNRTKNKEKRNAYKNALIDNIKKYSKKLTISNITKSENLELDSWFTSTIKTFKGKHLKVKVSDTYKETVIKCKKVIIYPNKEQKEILLNWMNSCIKMYNATLKFIKKRRFDGEKAIYDFKKLRTTYLKDIKENIRIESQLNTYKKDTKIMGHILDGAVKMACTSYKSALSNLKNGHIKHFRIRYLRESKSSKVLDLEQVYFSNKHNSFCTSVLGEYIETNGFNLTEIKKEEYKDCKLHYNKISNVFTLLIPIEEKTNDNQQDTFSSFDPGVRKFLSGISADHQIEIGTDIADKIRTYLEKININSNKQIPEQKKKRYERIYYKKIYNLVNDAHWKIINYLVKNYKTIFIGDWSTKNIGRKDTSNIDKMTKRIASMLSFYKFKQKLQYKCNKNRVNLIFVHEGYTSKLCSNCGWEHTNLGASKTFHCSSCKTTIDRDINGARNILFKGLV